MMKKLLPILLIVITGCTSPYTPDFAGMSSKYVNLLEQYQANMIFTNIIRSAHDRPISFLDIPTISGTGGITQGGSATNSAGSLVGSQGIVDLAINSLALNYNFSFTNGFNWSQASLDNQTFWQNFVTPVPISVSQYANHSNLPKELAATLSVASIELTFPDGTQKLYINNPLRPDYDDFQKALYRLLELGLGPQLTFTQVDVGDPMTEKELKDKYGAKPDYTLSKQGLVATVINSKPKIFQVQKLTPEYRLCLPKKKFSNMILQEYGPNLYCDDNPQIQAARKKSSTLPELHIAIRSSKDMYVFLGQVASLQFSDNPKIIKLPPTKTTHVKETNNVNEFAILIVEKNNSSGKKLARYESIDDNLYTIPMYDNGYSTTVMNLLTQFLTLAKSPGSIPTPPVVLVR